MKQKILTIAFIHYICSNIYSRKNITGPSFQINAEKIPAGIYIPEINQGNNRLIEKVIVQ